MIKHFLLSLACVLTLSFAYGQNEDPVKLKVEGKPVNVIADNDSIKLKVENGNAYYQHVVRLDSSLTVSKIYLRALEFMAAKNFQQNYGYDQEGKLICTTVQDLNNNDFQPGGGGMEIVDPYTVQFAITLDMRNRRYRYTINNVVFYLPTETGNMRLTLYDMYLRTQSDTRRVAKAAKNLLSTYEKYLKTLTDELHQSIEQNRPMDSTKF